MTVPFWPLFAVDVGGSLAMIVLSLLCLGTAAGLRRSDPESLLWIYLFWVCAGLAGFSVSRSAGHIVRQGLLLAGRDDLWAALRPYSSAANTFLFVALAAVTLFFERVWKASERIARDRQALHRAHVELLAVNRDLERLAGERARALAYSERQYRRIFEAARDPIAVLGPDGTIREINPAGAKLLGGGEEAAARLRGRPLVRYLARPDAWREIAAAIEGRGFVQNLEIDLKRADGTTFPALVSAVRDREESQAGAAVHLIARDIEERRRLQEQMAQADRLASIGQLSAGVAHEINNPLGVILGYTQLLLRGEPPGSDRYRDLKTIEKHVRHCKSIVEDLLKFARRSEPKQERVDIHRTIEEVLHFFGQNAAGGGIRLESDFDRRIPEVVVDEKKIKQVLLNLLMNARHAVGREGTIRVATRWLEGEGKFSLAVADDGCGIEEKDLPFIFDPFFTTKPTGEGTGLGLSVSYGIVRRHGGEIRVESRPGKGSVFTVLLPAVGAPPEEGP
ncbi:MAG: ATP-binding protein [Desulfobacterales bacterium]